MWMKGCAEAVDGFPSQLFPFLLRSAVSHTLTAALQWNTHFWKAPVVDAEFSISPCIPALSIPAPARHRQMSVFPAFTDAASVMGRTSQPCGVFGCQQSCSIPPCQGAFTAKIHLRPLVLPLPLHFGASAEHTLFFSKLILRKALASLFFFFF